MMSPCKICVSVGSNVEDAKDRVCAALKFLGQFMSDARFSTIYTTPAINGSGIIYHNAVAIGMVDMPIDKVVDTFKLWERENGRVHGLAAGDKCDVVIDLDVVMVNGKVVREGDFAREYFQCGYRELIV